MIRSCCGSNLSTHNLLLHTIGHRHDNAIKTVLGHHALLLVLAQVYLLPLLMLLLPLHIKRTVIVSRWLTMKAGRWHDHGL
jgi:hypothetical protein